MEETNLHRRIIEMACKFATKGANAVNVRIYQKTDEELIQMALAAAKKVGQREYALLDARV